MIHGYNNRLPGSLVTKVAGDIFLGLYNYYNQPFREDKNINHCFHSFLDSVKNEIQYIFDMGLVDNLDDLSNRCNAYQAGMFDDDGQQLLEQVAQDLGTIQVMAHILLDEEEIFLEDYFVEFQLSTLDVYNSCEMLIKNLYACYLICQRLCRCIDIFLQDRFCPLFLDPEREDYSVEYFQEVSCLDFEYNFDVPTDDVFNNLCGLLSQHVLYEVADGFPIGNN